MALFTQNSDLKKSGIFGWTLPAHIVELTNGEKFNTCPSAGACAGFCYAKTGTFKFSNVLSAHVKKLESVLFDRDKWLNDIETELKNKKYLGKFIRIHDAGDFFSIQYAIDWLNIAKKFPQITFYSYTKEVEMFKHQLKEYIPENFIVIYSFGGKQDHLIDVENDRHSDVFMDYEQMIKEGYIDIEADDKLSAISENKKIGLFRNNIPHYIKKMKLDKFSSYGKSKSKT